jgi:hypothetical protein
LSGFPEALREGELDVVPPWQQQGATANQSRVAHVIEDMRDLQVTRQTAVLVAAVPQ